MICVLSTDTPHHRYFINKLYNAGIHIDKIYFETTSVKPPFTTGPFFDEEMANFEQRFFKSTSSDISKYDTFYSKNINYKTIHRDLEILQPDLGIVFGTRLIKPHIISKFKDGLINVHRGIAEYYRGLDSDLWAIYHEDFQNIGVTIHRVDERLDTGEIVDQKSIKIQKSMKIFQLRYYTTLLATDMVIDVCKKYMDSGIIYSAPQRSIGRYYSFMPLDLKKYVAKKFTQLSQK